MTSIKRPKLTANYAGRLARAETSEAVGGILRQSRQSGIPDRILHGLVPKLPGYVFDRREGRFRTRNTPSQDQSFSLEEIAIQGGKAVANSLTVHIDKRHTQIRQVGMPVKPVGPMMAIETLRTQQSPAKRAAVMRAAVSLDSAVLDLDKAFGRWDRMRDDKWNRSVGVRMFEEPLGVPDTIEKHETAGVWWREWVDARSGIAFAKRLEYLVSVTHKELLMDELDGNSAPRRRCKGERRFDVVRADYFAVDHEIGSELWEVPDLMEEAYCARGEGLEHELVPAVGVLSVRHTLQLH